MDFEVYMRHRSKIVFLHFGFILACLFNGDAHVPYTTYNMENHDPTMHYLFLTPSKTSIYLLNFNQQVKVQNILLMHKYVPLGIWEQC